MALATGMLSAPADGLHPDVPSGEYHRWDALNNSFLSELSDGSPAAAIEAKRNPPAPTPDKRLGTAIHSAILQPKLFEQEYVVATKCAGKVAKGDACKSKGSMYRDGRWYCKTHDPLKDVPVTLGKLVIDQDDFDLCRRLQDAVWNHPLTGPLLSGIQPNDIELSGVHTDATDGLRRKIRTDGLRRDFRAIIDLKSTDNASETAFARSIDKFGYHRQAAFYERVLAKLAPGEFDQFWIIAIEKSAASVPAVYVVSDEDKQAGHEEVLRLESLYKQCVMNNIWPGPNWHWGDESRKAGYVVKTIYRPDWARRRIA